MDAVRLVLASMRALEPQVAIASVRMRYHILTGYRLAFAGAYQQGQGGNESKGNPGHRAAQASQRWYPANRKLLTHRDSCNGPMASRE